MTPRPELDTSYLTLQASNLTHTYAFTGIGNIRMH